MGKGTLSKPGLIFGLGLVRKIGAGSPGRIKEWPSLPILLAPAQTNPTAAARP